MNFLMRVKTESKISAACKQLVRDYKKQGIAPMIPAGIEQLHNQVFLELMMNSNCDQYEVSAWLDEVFEKEKRKYCY